MMLDIQAQKCNTVSMNLVCHSDTLQIMQFNIYYAKQGIFNRRVIGTQLPALLANPSTSQ